MAEGPEPGKYMTAEFRCHKCGHGWNSIRSLNLPEKCEKCKTKDCRPIVYRQATYQEQLQGRKMKMVAKYKCDRCDMKWKSHNSSGAPKACPACLKRGTTHIVKPYKYYSDSKQKYQRRRRPGRMFGFFECECGNEWRSAHTWEGKRQGCRNCDSMVLPYKTQPLQYTGQPGQKPHEESLCEMCQELGHSCTNYKPQKRTELVEVDEEESVISYGSTSTNSEDNNSPDDITPIGSDDEEGFLEDKFKNLTIKKL